MSHAIFAERFVERGERVSAWHTLGTSFTDDLTVYEAAEQAKLLEIIVRKHPLEVTLPDAAPLKVPNYYALVREPTSDDPEPRIFGAPVTKNYHPLQPRELVAALEGVNKAWPLETAGALDYGERLFFTFKAGERTLGNIRGEEMIEYFAVVDSLDGKHALRLFYTPTRVVCSNTLALALGAADSILRLEHTSSLQGDVEWLTQFFVAAERTREQTLEALEALTRVRLATAQRDYIIEAAYPLPAEPKKAQLLRTLNPDDFGLLMYTNLKAAVEVEQAKWELVRAKVEEHRGAVLALYERENETAPQIAGTAYALVNAVAEYSQFRGASQTKHRAASALFGSRADEQQRAAKAALALATLDI